MVFDAGETSGLSPLGVAKGAASIDEEPQEVGDDAVIYRVRGWIIPPVARQDDS